MTSSVGISSLTGYIPKSHYFTRMIAPPYDVLTRAEAHAISSLDPLSVLHVTRADASLPSSRYEYAAHVYQQAALNYQQLLQQNVLQPITSEYLIYQIEKAQVIQTGIIAVCDNSSGFIKTHEATRPAKLQDRIQLLQSVQAEISPVLLMHRHEEQLAAYLQRATQSPPDMEGALVDGSQHRIWRVENTAYLQRYLDGIPNLYVADGHHRLAASRAQQGTVLAALFSEQELNLLPYHRCVHARDDLTLAKLQSVLSHYDVQSAANLSIPQTAEQLTLYLNKSWYTLTERAPVYREFTDRFPSVRCQQQFLDYLQIIPEKELLYMGGGSANHMVHMVDHQQANIAIFLSTTNKADIISLSDKNYLMPPKSTWFDPKVADGIVFV